MEITIHVEAIQRDLASAAGLGDDDVARAGRRLADAVEASLRLRLLDVLGQAALSLNGQLRPGTSRSGSQDATPTSCSSTTPGEEEAPPTPGDDLSARITLRLPETLKIQLEEAAAREGVSANAWIVRALARALEPRTPTRRTGNRLQGYARG